ncbi:hypothetical protein AALO_G00288590 [Alosa alosa]|uniref:Uncharacterized protein n=1 Tax=Alosa alosa TaxID=278164 RepID=A0AAV6FH36_9TELE|nr:hypothetical protein AALO_G00288590 [Alosa alosa]
MLLQEHGTDRLFQLLSTRGNEGTRICLDTVGHFGLLKAFGTGPEGCTKAHWKDAALWSDKLYGQLSTVIPW